MQSARRSSTPPDFESSMPRASVAVKVLTRTARSGIRRPGTSSSDGDAMTSDSSVGLDFGTTNTALALADPAGEVAVVPFAGGESFRSVLHFLCPERPGRLPSGVPGS